MTSNQIIYDAPLFETVSFICGLMRGAESECCPLEPVVTPAPAPVVNPSPVMTPTAPVANESSGGSNGNILVIAISAVVQGYRGIQVLLFVKNYLILDSIHK